MKFTQQPDYSGVLLPSVPVDVAANAARLVGGAGDPTAATGDGVTLLSIQPLTTGPVTVAIAHPASKVSPAEIRYHIWANADVAALETVIDRMPVLLGID